MAASEVTLEGLGPALPLLQIDLRRVAPALLEPAAVDLNRAARVALAPDGFNFSRVSVLNLASWAVLQ